jgi:hypothetical protein
MKAKLQITTAELVPDKFGKHIKITKVKLMDENNKYIKFIKLDENIIDILKGCFIEIDLDIDEMPF